MSDEHAIVVEGLEKSYGTVRALCGVDFAARTGTVLGLLGPNGAGKTTAVRILATLLKPDAGTARVAGLDILSNEAELRTQIGLAGQYAAVDENLTGFENLEMVGQLYHLPRAEARSRANELLERFDLVEAGGRPAKTYSGGMRRRLDLAAALVYRPPVLFLDEPTTGLDPRGRLNMWETIEGRTAEGTTVLLTTQYLDEADRLADKIVVIDHGSVIAEGTSDELKDRVGGQYVDVRPSDPARLDTVARILAAVAGRAPESPSRGVLSVPVQSDAALTAVVRRLDDEGIGVTELALRLPSLDEVFFRLTGRHTTQDDGQDDETTPEPTREKEPVA